MGEKAKLSIWSRRTMVLFHVISSLSLCLVGCTGSQQPSGSRDSEESKKEDSKVEKLTEQDLTECIGRSLERSEVRLHIDKTKARLINEPPTRLRGVEFHIALQNAIMLFFDEDDATLMAQDEAGEWDLEALKSVRIVGARYEAGEEVLSVGSVPLIFRISDKMRTRGTSKQ
jgi:hypothetical protein